MTFKLGPFAGYISSHLPLQIEDGTGDLPAQIGHHENVIGKLCENARYAMLEDLVDIHKPDKLQRYITVHGRVLSVISGRLYKIYRQTENVAAFDGQKELLDFYRHTDQRISDLHLLLKENTPDSFDYAFQVPFTQFGYVKNRIAQYIPIVERLKQHLDSNNSPIIEIVLRPLRRFMDGISVLSFHEINYYRILLPALAAIKPRQGVDVNFHLHMLLISNNFNDAAYINHCNLKLLVKFDHKPPEERLTALLWYDTNLEQITPHPGLHLYRRNESARTQLATWVKASIVSLQSTLVPHLQATNTLKINTNFSIAEISLLTEVWMEMGLLPYMSKAALRRAIAHCITSKGTDQISIHSLEGHSANPGKGAVSHMIDVTLQTLSMLRKRL